LPRSSLRRLLATLACDEAVDGKLRLETLRAKASHDLAQLQSCIALGQNLSEARAPGIPPRAAPDGAAADLAPRLRLCVASGEHVLAVALSESRYGVDSGVTSSTGNFGRIAVVLSTGRIEVWDRDLFCWHHASTAHVPLRGSSTSSAACSVSCSATWAEGASLLWLFVDETSPGSGAAEIASTAVTERKPERRLLLLAQTLGELRLVASADLAGSLVAGPVPVLGGASTAAVALDVPGVGPSNVLLFTWHQQPAAAAGAGDAAGGQAVAPQPETLATLRFRVQLRGGGAADSAVGGLWSLSPSAAMQSASGALRRFAIWVRPAEWVSGFTAAGELQICNDLGQCLGILPLRPNTLQVTLPQQGQCPEAEMCRLGLLADPPPLVVLMECQAGAGAEWTVGIAAVDDATPVGEEAFTLQFRPLQTTEVPAAAKAVVASEGLLGCVSEAGAFLLNWQQAAVHQLPTECRPLAVGSHSVALLKTGLDGSELIFLEPW